MFCFFLTSRWRAEKCLQKWHTKKPLTKCDGCILFLRTFSEWLNHSWCFSNNHQIRLSGIWSPLNISCWGNLGVLGSFWLTFRSEWVSGICLRFLALRWLDRETSCISIHTCMYTGTCLFVCIYLLLFPSKTKYKMLSIQQPGILK